MRGRIGIFIFIGLFGAAVLAVLLFFTADVRQDAQTLKIGVFAYDMNDPFIAGMVNSLRDIVSNFELEQDERFYFNIQDAQQNQSVQNRQIERYLSLDYDVLCVNLVDRTSAAHVIDKAMEADVPVVFFNREPVQADMLKWDQLYYVGTDGAMNGVLQGYIIADEYQRDSASLDRNGDGAIQYVILEGEFRHQDAVLRTRESVQTILNAGIKMEKLNGGVANWNRSQAFALAKEYFTQYGGQIELVLCNNDDMALGVLDYIADSGLDFTNVVGIDSIPEGLKAVEEGRMLGTVDINCQGQAELIFLTAYTLLMEGKPEQAVTGMAGDRTARAPMHIVTKNFVEFK